MKPLLLSQLRSLRAICRARSAITSLFTLSVLLITTFFSASVGAQTTTCPSTISNPTPATVSIASGQVIASLSVTTNATGTDAIRFRYFLSPQTASAAYGSGFGIGLATPAGGTATVTNVSFPANNTNADVVYYVYSVLNIIPGDASCRPFAEIVVTVKPVVCPTITSPLPATEISLCSGDKIPSLQVSTSATGTDAIRFRYFATPQTGAGAYGSGFAIGLATPSGGTATVTNVAIQTNNTTADVLYYAYAILNSIPANTNCRPVAEFVIRVKPKPKVVNATRSICDDGADNKETINLTALNSVVNANTTNAVVWYSDSLNTTIGAPNAFVASGGTTIVFAKITGANGCFGVARVTLKVAAPPVVSATAKLEQCAAGTSAVFNLPDANPQIATGTGLTFKYFASQTNASANATPIANTYTGGSTTLFVRVSNGGGCDAVAPLEITVSPKPNAGSDQTTTCIDNVPATSATLTATSIDTGTWTKLSGGTASITTAGSKSTSVTGLSVGVYEFVFTTTKSCKDTVKVTVQSCGTPPTCPTISIADRTDSLCSDSYGPSILVQTTATDSIKFVYFSTKQTGTAMYTGGTLIQVSLPSSDGVAGAPNGLPGLQLPANNGNAPVDYYVYAILNAPTVANCRPFAEKVYTVLPLPAYTITAIPVCKPATKYKVKLNISSPGTYKLEVGTGLSTIGSGFNVDGIFLTIDAIPSGKDTVLTFDVAGDKFFAVTKVGGCNKAGLLPAAILQDCDVEIDLSLKKTVSKSVVALNEKVIFTLKVFNEGAVKATGVEVTDSLTSAAFGYVAGSAKPSGVNFNETTKVWKVGDLNPGDSATLTFEAILKAEGVSFNKAEITKANEKDRDSTPANNAVGEDDIAQQCVSVPIKFCNTDQIEVTITAPANYGSYQWFRAESATAAPVLISTAVANAYTATKAGYYTFVVSGGILGTCTGSNCCPIIITSEDCGCPAPPCVPFVFKKTKTATRQ